MTLISVAAGLDTTRVGSLARDQSQRLHGAIDRAFRAIVTSPHCLPSNRGLWAARYVRFVTTSSMWQILSTPGPSSGLTSGPSSGPLAKAPQRSATTSSSSSSHATTTSSPSPCPVASARRSCEDARRVYTLVMDAVCARPELRVG